MDFGQRCLNLVILYSKVVYEILKILFKAIYYEHETKEYSFFSA